MDYTYTNLYHDIIFLGDRNKCDNEVTIDFCETLHSRRHSSKEYVA